MVSFYKEKIQEFLSKKGGKKGNMKTAYVFMKKKGRKTWEIFIKKGKEDLEI
jgi:hypothetical protein